MTATAILSEKEIFSLSIKNEKQAVSFLYDKYAPLLYGIILRSTNDQPIATQILEFTFLNFYQQFKTEGMLENTTFIFLLKLVQKVALSNFQIHLNLKPLAIQLTKEVYSCQKTTSRASLNYLAD